MVVFPEYKYLYISTQKSGTHAMYDYLQRCGGKRHGAYHEKIIPEKYKDYKTFITVRNPFDRAVSSWWALTTHDNGKGRQKWALDSIGGKSFDLFAKWLNSPKCKKGTRMTWSQTEIHKDKKIDFYIKLEEIEEELRKLPFYKDIPIKNTHTFQKERGLDWSDYYDKHSAEDVMEAWREDFTNFDYIKISNSKDY